MKLLLVEDEHRIAEMIKRGLEQERYAVDVAHDGESGYDMAATETYDVMIFDRMMPRMDGVTLTKRLRAENNHTPILLLTAKSQTSDKIEGLDSGADDYLTKPFSFEELLARIRALARRPKKTFSTLLTHATIEIDSASFHVIRNNKKIDLSSREYSVLEYLMRNKGRVCSKTQIIEHVWDFESDILPNTVEVTIRNIRNKLEKPFPQEKPVIRTIRGFGYTIDEES